MVLGYEEMVRQLLCCSSLQVQGMVLVMDRKGYAAISCSSLQVQGMVLA